MLDEKFIEKMKMKLKQEEATLELELTDIGRLHNASSGDWTANAGDLVAGTEDSNVFADKMEEVITNEAIVDELEIRLQNVKKALQKIKEGTYGICERCNKEIEIERLEANPAANLCIECAQDEE